jgi:hypothetical protein
MAHGVPSDAAVPIAYMAGSRLASFVEVHMSKQKMMPKPIRIARKLTLSSEKLVVMTGAETMEQGGGCTLRQTGCPIHTC